MVAHDAEALRIGIRVDAFSRSGVGHFVRQSALIEELQRRGHDVVLLGETDIPWVWEAAAAAGLDFQDPSGRAVAAQAFDVLMVDGYDIPASFGTRLRESGTPVAAMVDGEFGRHQVADLYVDQNLGAEAPPDPGATWLVGPEYVLLRDAVLANREVPRQIHAPPRCLVVFGGSDPYGGAPVATQLLLSISAPVEVVVIGATDEIRDRLRAQPIRQNGSSLEVLGPQDDLPALAVSCDLAVSAAGSTVWELACLGVPSAIVCVVDNQALGYRAATRELAVGLGHLEELRTDADARTRAADQLERLVSLPELRRARGDRGQRLVDGMGKRRVADALETLARG